MKIGILTFHNALNYGAVLQCYATQEIIRSMGHDVEVIDYHNVAIEKNYSLSKYSYYKLPKKIWKWPSYLLTAYNFHKRIRSFELFRASYLKLTEKRFDYHEMCDLTGFDIILIGSDQLWNIDITNGFDNVYWGCFRKDDKTKVLAWSISMNYIPSDANSQQKICQYLNNFDGISVREKKLHDVLLDDYRRESSITLDPTLLLNVKKWRSLCNNTHGNEDYIAVYAVEKSTFSATYDVAKRLARKTGLKLKIIKSYSDSSLGREVVQSASPDGFLSYIDNSKYVVTSSFHGTVFSILFHKSFFALSYINGRQNDRINSLLYHVGLEQCAINQDESFNELSAIAYDIVDLKLMQLKRQTLDFLNQFGV